MGSSMSDAHSGHFVLASNSLGSVPPVVNFTSVGSHERASGNPCDGHENIDPSRVHPVVTEYDVALECSLIDHASDRLYPLGKRQPPGNDERSAASLRTPSPRPRPNRSPTLDAWTINDDSKLPISRLERDERPRQRRERRSPSSPAARVRLERGRTFIQGPSSPPGTKRDNIDAQIRITKA
jgi:hypothetical protein